ncbi:uncharacterized protein LOC124457585 [Xenia sp. Carnegie-2017]|uniref:uncharacterized protein LOC124457585 n=1 Tax=Xenia sp. Carnegie-2017 TaxID=2897299 RepID=UPI001F04C36A|nr:uncharacterized protein LOC124457585 [Xenia sp. Carnegie-2017]
MSAKKVNVELVFNEIAEDLDMIRQGEGDCERYRLFYKSSCDRDDLNFNVPMGFFTTNEHEETLQLILERYNITKASNLFDFASSVLLPEALIRIYGTANNFNYKKAEANLFIEKSGESSTSSKEEGEIIQTSSNEEKEEGELSSSSSEEEICDSPTRTRHKMKNIAFHFEEFLSIQFYIV